MSGWRVRQKSLLRVRKRHRRVVAGAQWSRIKVCRERAAFCLRLGRRDSADLLLLSRADRAVTARQLRFSVRFRETSLFRSASSRAGGTWFKRRIDHEGELYADRKSTRLKSSHANISYAVFCLK